MPKKTTKGRPNPPRRIGARTIVFFLLLVLALGAVAIAVNQRLELKESGSHIAQPLTGK